ncbi:hypothetical protein JCM8202_004099 [Rhodotorula sphaerocarpa]
MALTSAKLPAPLRLRAEPRSLRPLSLAEAHSHLASFLASDASALCAGAAGTGATRASIVTLVKGIHESIDAQGRKPAQGAAVKSEDHANEAKGDSKKRKKSDATGEKKDKKRRKTAA